jgi:hypothetical protein
VHSLVYDDWLTWQHAMRESVYFPFFKCPAERHVGRCPQTLVERVNIGFRASESYFGDAASSSIGSLVGRSQRLILIPWHACPNSIPTSRSRELHPQPDVLLADRELGRELARESAPDNVREWAKWWCGGENKILACGGKSILNASLPGHVKVVDVTEISRCE